MVDDDDNVKEQKRILKELRDNDAANTEVKGMIEAYNPTVQHDTNVKKLKRFSTKTLEQAAIFLGAKPTDDSGKQRYKSKASLIDWLIMAIEGLFEQFCGACECYYTIKKGDECKSKFRCSSYELVKE